MATATSLGTFGTASNWSPSQDATGFTTPTADTEVFVGVSHEVFSGSVPTHTISGLGLTWEKVTDLTTAAGNRRLTLWRGRGASPSGTTITVTLDTAGTQLRLSVVAMEVDGIAEDVQVQIVTAEGTGTEAGVTLAAFADAANPTLLLTYTEENEPVITLGADSPMVMVAKTSAGSENNTTGISFYDGNDLTPSHSWSGSELWLAIGVELDADGGAAAQNVTLDSVLSLAAALTAPVVAAGVATIAPALLSAGPTLHAPTVAAGAVAVQPPLLSLAPTVTAPSVSSGPAAVAVPLLSVAPVLQAPVVAAGPVTVAVPLLTVSTTLHQPTVRITQTAAVPLLSLAPTLTAPTVNAGAVTVQPPLLSLAPTLTAPVVNQEGAIQVVELGVLSVAPVLHSPVVAAGGVAVAVPLLSAAPTLSAPAVVSVAAVAVPALSLTPTLFAPALDQPLIVLVPLLSLSPALIAIDVNRQVIVGEILELGGTAPLVGPGGGDATGPRIGQAIVLSQSGQATRLLSDGDVG